MCSACPTNWIGQPPNDGQVWTVRSASTPRGPFTWGIVEIPPEDTPEKTTASELVYVVRHCDVLIAVGNPDDPQYQAVREALDLQLFAQLPRTLGALRGDPLGSFSERGPAVLLRPDGQRSVLVPP